ncbi:MAG: hypothetical protein M3492_01845 [Actinomycetota bacterium]|nr:hypothetical protein [Actinomycetota bacterium]
MRGMDPAPAHTAGTADMTVDIVDMTTDTSTATATVGAMMAPRKAVSVSIAPKAARDSRSDPQSSSDQPDQADQAGQADQAAITTSMADIRVMAAPASVLPAHGEHADGAEAAVPGVGGTYAQPSWSCSTSSRGTGTS